MKFRKIKSIFFVGIGGIGMSGIAELLHNLAFDISGSDLIQNENVCRLQSIGIKVHIGHHPNNISGYDALVYSSAIPMENSELIRARQKGIPVIKRAEMLGELLNFKETSIAVGGTHGKTTTSSMVGTLLNSAKMDPTLIVGGLVQNLNSNSTLGNGEIIVAEADEFDRSFLALKPTINIVTNIELEHTDCYKDLQDLQKAFINFCKSVPFYGESIVCIDSPAIREILPYIERPMTTYGRSRDAAYRARKIRFNENKSTYTVSYGGKCLGEINLNVPGEHNVMNSLAAVTLGLEMGLSFDEIQKGIRRYSGVRRRFEIKGIHNNIMVVDDYAHHPTEVKATIQAAKIGWDRRILTIFQPHLFSRTRDFYKEFASALQLADYIILTDIYPAREKPIPNISSKIIYDEIQKIKRDYCVLVADLDKLTEEIFKIVKPGDMILTMGAGSIWRYCEFFYNELLQQK